MSNLYARLLAQLGDRFDNYAVEVDRRGAALRAVVELHEPVQQGSPIYGYFTCGGCDNGSYAIDSPDWPCSTIEAIARELGVGHG